MDDGFLIRELPGGSSEFVLEDPALSFVRVDRQSTLQFGATGLTIGAPFTLELDGTVHSLDPHRRDGLGPLVALYPSTLRWLWTSSQGELTAVFFDGATVRVPPHPVVRAWAVGNVACLPTGTG